MNAPVPPPPLGAAANTAAPFDLDDVRPRWLRRASAAKYVGLSAQTLNNLAARVPRQGPEFHVPPGSRTPLYDIAALDAWVRGRTQPMQRAS